MGLAQSIVRAVEGDPVHARSLDATEVATDLALSLGRCLGSQFVFGLGLVHDLLDSSYLETPVSGFGPGL